jgi:arylsulfatase A-like enzyme
LTKKNIYKETLVIVASKHGQTPIDPSKYGTVDPDAVTNATKVDVLFQTVRCTHSLSTAYTDTRDQSDDIALIFLKNHSDTQTAANNLAKDRDALKIDDIIFGQRLISEGYGNPKTDTAVPDIIVRPKLGIIFTTTNASTKIAEHGGISVDDTHVACFVSNPMLKKAQFNQLVSTRQVAPTILSALGLDVKALKGAQAEGTTVLDGF